MFLPLLLRSEWIIARHSSCLPVEHLQSPDRGCLSKLPSTRFGHDSQSFVLRADILCNTVVIMDFDLVGRFGNSGIDIEGTAQSLLKFSRRVLEIRRHEILEFSIPSLAPSPYVGYLKSLQFDLKEGNVHVWREEVGAMIYLFGPHRLLLEPDFAHLNHRSNVGVLGNVALRAAARMTSSFPATWRLGSRLRPRTSACRAHSAIDMLR